MFSSVSIESLETQGNVLFISFFIPRDQWVIEFWRDEGDVGNSYPFLLLLKIGIKDSVFQKNSLTYLHLTWIFMASLNCFILDNSNHLCKPSLALTMRFRGTFFSPDLWKYFTMIIGSQLVLQRNVVIVIFLKWCVEFN